MTGGDRVEDRARARRRALDALGFAAPTTHLAEIAWSCVCHPLALAVLEHRSPGTAWIDDPFAMRISDPSEFEDFRLPVVRWDDGVATVNGLPMPRRGVDPRPDTANGVDSRRADETQVAYRVDTMVGKPTIVEFTGTLPDSMDAMIGRPLHEVVEMPPIADAALLAACRALVVADVSRNGGSTSIVLEPVRWTPLAPVPDAVRATARIRDLEGASETPDLAFLDIDIVS